jgi:hypothetical protein
LVDLSRYHTTEEEMAMADYFHTHSGARCSGTHHHSSCQHTAWQYVCGTASPHRCLHLDPSIPGVPRVLKALKAAGVKVYKGKKAAKKRKR